MHKQLIKFLNFTNEGKEINVERVLTMLASPNEAQRDLILNHETNEHFHQNMPEDAIFRAIVEYIDENEWNTLENICGYSYKAQEILNKSLSVIFKSKYDCHFNYLEEAKDFLKNERENYMEWIRNTTHAERMAMQMY